MALKGRLNCNKCTHFLLIPTKKIWVYQRLFVELFIVIINEKKNTFRIYSLKKDYFQILNLEVMFVMLQTALRILMLFAIILLFPTFHY